MNTKRQTIWLVSMLSLMVILSAYYLFTEDLNSPSNNLVSENAQTDKTAGQNITEATAGGKDDAIVVNEVEGDQAEVSGSSEAEATGATDPTGTDASDKGDKAAGDGDKAAASEDGKETAAAVDEVSDQDKQVLDQLETQGVTASVNSIFNEVKYKQQETFQKEQDQLMNVISNTKDASGDDAKEATTKLDLLEEKMDKITALEEELSQLYPMAVVDTQQDRYKVVVQSENLERSKAAEIVDMVTKSLDVTPDRVTVQYVS
ncbi:mutants block sporulation after engulfment (stage III sporulation) [Paenibacillus curdlanolyticus YK9]|uniref:Mutants block sporulation after engulfment (Stage III sporulation) n=1 Tax=Paenibacillus curdlanolyticus YK9 TaxID=717606 RepID=E0ICJ3_9BACL|nr:SpoIIIAH-like family protein [Paenibacillus curdlanolyticus]EFM09879.1 mutants block sporulation after engulfment (stage III sporulation) [Paenibacillus curdlanolyticus YK9]